MSKTDHIEMHALHTNDQQSPPRTTSHPEDTWSFRRALHKPEEKHLMAQYSAEHDFLVSEGQNPVMAPRETVASILVNQGTTPNIVVKEALNWIKTNKGERSFDITWYTPGSLVPATLRAFRLKNPDLSAATQGFLFPGRVDFGTEAVSGPEAVAFAEQLETCFTYAFLSAYSFDINAGTVYFNYSEEVRLQRACARRYAAHKFLFLDSSKFKREGNAGYKIDDLLETAETVTIYTVSSQKDPWIKAKFELLCDRLLESDGATLMSEQADTRHPLDMKSLRLRIVGRDETSTFSTKRQGFPIPHLT